MAVGDEDILERLNLKICVSQFENLWYIMKR